jgi:hypothetical protein
MNVLDHVLAEARPSRHVVFWSTQPQAAGYDGRGSAGGLNRLGGGA